MWVVLWMILALFSYWDMKDKQLPGIWLFTAIAASAGLAAINNASGKEGINIWQIFTGMLPGIFLTTLAFAMKGKLGSGDGLVLIIIGNMVGMKRCLLIFLAAVLLSFVYSCLLLGFFRKSREYSFPFVPFYFLGAVLIKLIT